MVDEVGSRALPGESHAIFAPLDRYRAVADPRHAWPRTWPGSLPESNRLWRADVFAVAEAWRAGHCEGAELLTAVSAWGHGPNGYGPWRTARALAPEDLANRLAALEPLRSALVSTEDLTTAYKSFNNRSTGLPWFRAPFFTKLLYFAGYRRGVGGVQPLILDSVVDSRIPADIGVRKPARRGVSPAWHSEEWLRYCTWARETSASEPDEVEMALFNQGPAPLA